MLGNHIIPARCLLAPSHRGIEDGGQPWPPGRDTPVTLNPPPPLAAHAATEAWIAGERGHGMPPLSRIARQESGFTVRDEFTMNPDFVRDNWQACGHVLQHLQATLSQAPRMIWQPRDTDVGAGECGGLRRGGPARLPDADAREPRKCVADHLERQVGHGSCRRPQTFVCLDERGDSALAADPSESHAPWHTVVIGE